MKVEVFRFETSPDETFGKLFIDGVFQCYTIEDTYRPVKIKKETRIPAGTYKLGLVNSPKFTPIYGHEMLWVKDVPNFQGILIHTGNTKDDTEGCLIVGMRIGAIEHKRAVLDSKIAYKIIYPFISKAIKEGHESTITYYDHEAPASYK